VGPLLLNHTVAAAAAGSFHVVCALACWLLGPSWWQPGWQHTTAYHAVIVPSLDYWRVGLQLPFRRPDHIMWHMAKRAPLYQASSMQQAVEGHSCDVVCHAQPHPPPPSSALLCTALLCYAPLCSTGKAAKKNQKRAAKRKDELGSQWEASSANGSTTDASGMPPLEDFLGPSASQVSLGSGWNNAAAAAGEGSVASGSVATGRFITGGWGLYRDASGQAVPFVVSSTQEEVYTQAQRVCFS